jgi:hypothetical protein
MKLRVLASVVSLAAVTGCGTGQVGQLPNQSTTSPSSFALGFAVGTARIATSSSASTVGLNVVATFRAPGGQNATLANTPTLTGPAKFPSGTPGVTQNSVSGVSPTDILAAANVKAGTPPPGAFGSLIGVYGYGFAPLNIVAIAPNVTVYSSSGCDGSFESLDLVQNSGASIRYDALALPLDFALSCPISQPSVQWYGGPPAWPASSGFGIPTGDPAGEYFHGYPFGFMDFDDVAPVAGAYTLNVAFGDSATGTQYANATASANLSTTAALPVIAPPVLTVNGDGSGTVQLTVPPGVTEAIVEIAASYCQQTAALSHYYSLLTKQTGPQTLVLSNNLGPVSASGTPTHTFCTAADDALPGAQPPPHRYAIAAAGFDYPAYEASYPQSTALSPTISNVAGQADVTTSTQTNGEYTETATGQSRPRTRGASIRHRP